MSRSTGRTAALLTLSCVLWSTGVRADDPAAHAERARAASTCVDVAINDHPVLAYDCLNQQLALPATGGAAVRGLDASDVARLPSNQQVGQFNLSSFSHRMGANLGKSVFPQRPPSLSGSTSPLLSVPITGH
jgi:hypothetical protein